jgi:hypothetical protein
MDRKEIIVDVIEVYKGLSDVANTLDDIFHNTDGPLFDYSFRALDGYVEYAAKYMKIDPENLFWFIYDNDCGKLGLKIIDTEGKSYEISGIDCFVEYINEWYPIDDDE